MREDHLPKATQYKKSNVVIHSLYNMSLHANRVFTYLGHIINTRDISNEELENGVYISLEDLQDAKLIDTRGKACTIEHLKSIGDEIQHVSFSCYQKGLGFVSMIVVPTIGYDENVRGFVAKINKDAIPLLRDMSHGFSLLDISELGKIDSAYTFRLYEIIKSEIYERKNGYIPSYEISVEELKFLLGMCIVTRKAGTYLLKNAGDYKGAYKIAIQDKCNQNTCEDWRMFKRTLDRCVKKINDVTDIRLSYRPNKRGRAGKIETLIFSVASGDEDIAVNDDTYNESIDSDVADVVSSVLHVVNEESNRDSDPGIVQRWETSKEDMKEKKNPPVGESKLMDVAEMLQQEMRAFSIQDIAIMLGWANGSEYIIRKQYKNFLAYDGVIRNPMGWMKTAIMSDFGDINSSHGKDYVKNKKKVLSRTLEDTKCF